ncbi:MAG TPA: hypothetical protein VIY26_04430 [Acidimicrobiales bacterium]
MGLTVAGVVGSACSSAPSTPSGSGVTTTTVRVPPRQHETGSTTSTTVLGTTTTVTARPGTSPTLGIAAAWARVGPSVAGFGQVRPSEISLGGDPTGVLSGIIWQSWGGATATGTGTSTYVAPGQTVAQGSQQSATVVASELATCAGTPAYQQVKWYFPSEGEILSTGATTTVNTCTGP